MTWELISFELRDTDYNDSGCAVFSLQPRMGTQEKGAFCTGPRPVECPNCKRQDWDMVKLNEATKRPTPSPRDLSSPRRRRNID